MGQLDFLDRPGGDNAVVTELGRIYQAGCVKLPGAANTYNDAAAGVNDCDIPAPLRKFFPRSIPKFNEPRDQLSDIFMDTRDSLSDAGVALVNTAKNYELTDAENEQLLTEINEINTLYPPPVSYST